MAKNEGEDSPIREATRSEGPDMAPRWVVNHHGSYVVLTHNIIRRQLRDHQGRPMYQRVQLRIPPGLSTRENLRMNGKIPSEEDFSKLTTDKAMVGVLTNHGAAPGTPMVEVFGSPAELYRRGAHEAVRLVKNTASPQALEAWLHNDPPKAVRKAIQEQLITIKTNVARQRGRAA